MLPVVERSIPVGRRPHRQSNTVSKCSWCVAVPNVTRPDIQCAVQQVCLFMHDPRVQSLNALKRIIRYVKGTLDHGLQLYRSKVNELTAYSDADWVGCPDTQHSTSGCCVYLGDNLISWSSKTHQTVFRSSAEAEYRGVANTVAETCW